MASRALRAVPIHGTLSVRHVKANMNDILNENGCQAAGEIYLPAVRRRVLAKEDPKLHCSEPYVVESGAWRI